MPAHQRAQRWAHCPRKPSKLAIHRRLRRAVVTLLAHRWLPEQIAHGLPQRYPDEPTMRVYVAHPRCPWERGTNENTNGLLRQFFPKGTRFTQVSRTEIKRVQTIFNDRPRKVLNWHSPAQAFHHLVR